ncbi:MAG: hypothetical protein GY708_09520 [Actinomycetia bacterium]|nr:hypothetical protein [Actinomycetes bacterium]MCP4960404.1 hypothetical protein [Actinomycetes bacterium]
MTVRTDEQLPGVGKDRMSLREGIAIGSQQVVVTRTVPVRAARIIRTLVITDQQVGLNDDPPHVRSHRQMCGTLTRPVGRTYSCG